MPSSERNGPIEPKLKIYFSNLLCRNLFCGFVALTKIVKRCPERIPTEITIALGYILLARIFDLLTDGLPHGRRKAFLHNLVLRNDFGAAPAFLVHRWSKTSLRQESGLFIASVT
jgi:phosphatidylserine synthase